MYGDAQGERGSISRQARSTPVTPRLPWSSSAPHERAGGLGDVAGADFRARIDVEVRLLLGGNPRPSQARSERPGDVPRVRGDHPELTRAALARRGVDAPVGLA